MFCVQDSQPIPRSKLLQFLKTEGETFKSRSECVFYISSLDRKYIWCVIGLLLISDGKSEHVAHALRIIGLFKDKKIQFVTDFELIKCLKR